MSDETKVTKYDSTNDTLEHMRNIKNVFNLIIFPELEMRMRNHDNSKLQSPEKETYDKFIPLLRTAKYGTPEYTKIRDDMQKEGLSHHYNENRHHPEHFGKDLVSGMNIVDLVEMICDWFAASLKSDTTFIDGLQTNIEKYNLPDMMVDIVKNTYNDYFKDFEYIMKHNVDDKNEYVKDLKLRLYETYTSTNPYLCGKNIQSINDIINK